MKKPSEHCKVHPAVALPFPCPLCMVAAEVRVMEAQAKGAKQDRIHRVEGVIAEELGRGDHEVYVKDYTRLAAKIVEALDE